MDLSLRARIENLYADDRDRILATLIGMLHDFDLAEDAMQEAFAAALIRWSQTGIAANPRAWIVSTARHKALDRLRRDSTLREKLPELRLLIEQEEANAVPAFHDEAAIEDDRLRLIFTCCHPALGSEAQVALTLRTLCGLETEEIARAFLVSPQTMAQRLVRVKRKISQAGIPYSVPPKALLGARIDAVLVTIYLIFTAGYTATSGDSLVKKDLCAEAIRLARLLTKLMPGHGDATALLALMLFHDSRRNSRADAEGNIVLLEDQDRAGWNHAFIQEGVSLLAGALREGAAATRYFLEAQIAEVHATASLHEDTDWRRIVGLFAELNRITPSPVVELNMAVAVAMAEGPDAGLARLADLEASGRLDAYHFLPAAQARLLEQLGRRDEAIGRYRRALTLARNEPERRFLAARLAHCREAERSG